LVVVDIVDNYHCNCHIMVSTDVKQEPIEYETLGDEDSSDEKSPLLTQSRDTTASSRSRSQSPEPREDPRFHRPTPSPFKRLGLLLLLFFLFWAGLQLRSGLLEAKQKPKIVHASRYSKEHKYRPAASPIITETLKDGRTRLRGALPPTPTPITTPKTRAAKKKARKGPTGGKKVASKGKHKPGSGKRI